MQKGCVQMELHGTIEANLGAAINSSRRLKGHPIHPDTLNHWMGVLREARQELLTDGANAILQGLIVELEQELADQTSA